MSEHGGEMAITNIHPIAVWDRVDVVSLLIDGRRCSEAMAVSTKRLSGV